MKKLICSLFIAISLFSFSCSDTPEEKLMKARVEITLKNFDYSILLIKKIIQENPKMAEAYYYKGMAEHGANKIDSAIASFSKSIELNKNFVGAYVERAKIEQSQRNFDKSIIDYSYAITLFPQDPELFFQRGLAYYNTYQETNACTDFKIASDMGHIEAERFHLNFCKKKIDTLSN